MRRSLLRFLRLSPAEQRLFFLSAILLPLVACTLRIFGLPKVQARLEQRCRRADLRESANIGANTIARMVIAASRHGPVRGNCLSQSLVLWYLLQQKGHDARMLLGGRRDRGAFEAHAWVEVDGQVVNGGDDVREFFTPFEAHVNNELTIQK